jgi:hypothetical protein
LGPTDSNARTQAKINGRERSPVLTRLLAEKARPISAEGSRTGGTANKTNSTYTNKAAMYGKVGAGLAGFSTGVSAYNIATAQNKGDQAAAEVTSASAAVVGGELGAGIGSVAGPPGAIVGGLIGSMVGSVAGSSAVQGSMNKPQGLPSQKIDEKGKYLAPQDGTRR